MRKIAEQSADALALILPSPPASPCTHTHIHKKHIHTRTHIRKLYAHTHAHAQNVHACAHARLRTCMHAHKHACTSAYTNRTHRPSTQTQMQTQTHTTCTESKGRYIPESAEINLNKQIEKMCKREITRRAGTNLLCISAGFFLDSRGATSRASRKYGS